MLGSLWGGIPSVAKYVTLSGVPPTSYAFWVHAIAAVLLLSVNRLKRDELPFRHLKLYLICGMTGSAIPQIILYLGLKVISAGLMSILIALTPICTYLLAVVSQAERHHKLKTAGVLLGFIGAVLIIVPDADVEVITPTKTIIFCLIMPVLFAISTVYAARFRPPDLDTLPLCTGMLITAATALFGIALITEPLHPLWKQVDLVGILIIYHGIITAVGYIVFFWLIKSAGPLFSSQVTYIITVVGIAIGAYVYNEVLSLLVWMSAGLIFLGTAFIQRARWLEQTE